MFHLEVLLRHLGEYCGCHYACAEQDVRFLTQHVHLLQMAVFESVGSMCTRAGIKKPNPPKKTPPPQKKKNT